jgi:hypothetical protein
MAQAAQKLDEMTVPDGGIGNFIMDDAEIEAAYGDDDDGMEEYGDEGIAQFPALTKKMAAMGREGDDVIGHLQTGELVIPLALIEQDEALKEGIFQRLRDMGVEDPERYVVGSASNSINPDTGAAEFFLKNLSKTVAKAVKSVVKVIRKVAPIILPIALSFTPLGPVFGAALGSGIGTLIQGGSIKDALKSALIAGATGAVFSGFTGTGSFLGNIEASVADPIGRLGQTFSGAETSLSNVFGGEAARAANAGQQTFFSDYIAPTAASTGAATPADMNSSIGGELVGADNDILVGGELVGGANNDILVGGQGVDTFPAGGQIPAGGDQLRAAETSFARLNNTGAPVEVTLANGAGQTIPAGGQIPAGAAVNPTVTAYEPPSFWESLTEGDFLEAFFPSGPTDAQVQLAKTTAYNDAFNAVSALPGTTTAQAAQAGLNAMNATTASSIGPGLLRAYGPMAGVGAGVAAASGFFSSPEQEQLGIAARDENGNIITGEDLVAANPSQYLVSDLGSIVLDPTTGTYVPRPVNPMAPYQAPTQYGLSGTSPYLQGSTPGGPFARPYVAQAAEGGAIFPRRNGGIMPDEGIPGQDSVQAMLMPGEFVMTTDAVRGMGNGNLNNGIKNMYSVMRNLEARGRA